MSGSEWLSDEAWAVIEPHLPNGGPGARRVDDRRVISGILHVLRSGCRWRDCPAEHGPPTTMYNNRWSAQGVWRRIFERPAAAAISPMGSQSTAPTSKPTARPPGLKGGEAAQAIGRSRGGRTCKIHAVANAQGRPIVFVLMPGNVADISVAADLLEEIAPPLRLLADKAYDPITCVSGSRPREPSWSFPPPRRAANPTRWTGAPIAVPLSSSECTAE